MNRTFFAIIQLFVFSTGFAGLTYQVAWHKYLSRILGSDSFSAAIILSTFLGGLSIGYFACGRMTKIVKNQLKAYAYLEGIIGLWCLNFPWLFNFFERLTDTWSFAPPVLIILQGIVLSVLLTGVPTICMGATVPFLTRGLSANITESTNVHAIVYAINTIGASLGALAGGFLLIPEFGLPLTVMGTGAINIIVFLFFFVISNYWKATQDPQESFTSNAEVRFPTNTLYIVAFLSGCYVMALENLLIRFINLSFGSSSYSFTIIVSVFIFSIALGSFFIGGKRHISRQALFYNQCFIVAGLIILFFTLDSWPYLSHLIRIGFQSTIVGFIFYYIVLYITLLLILVFPVACMGATVPLAFHEIKRNLANVGRHSGYLFAWNTLGNMIGSLFGGIVLFYYFGLEDIFLLSIALVAISLALISFQLSSRYRLVAVVTVIITLLLFLFPLGYEQSHFKLGPFRLRSPQSFSLEGPRKFFNEFNKETIEYYDDDPTGTVAVLSSESRNPIHFKSIIVNGKSDSNTYFDRDTLKLSAHIPALFAPHKKNALVIGLGTGMTAGEMSLHEQLEQIDVAEISPSVIKALPFFKEDNHNLAQNPKVNIVVGDAFRILKRSEKKWDIITSEPSNVWVTGVDSLFTSDFYRLVRSRLSDNGVFAQWFQYYDANPEMVGMVMNTIHKHFEDVHTFITLPGDILIMATPFPLKNHHIEKASREFGQASAVTDSLATIGIFRIEDILIREIWSKPYIDEHFEGYLEQTLDNPRLHYLAGKAFFYGQTISTDYFLHSASVKFRNSYLLNILEPGWSDHPISKEELSKYVTASKGLFYGSDYYLDSIRIKHAAGHPADHGFSAKKAKNLGLPLLPFIVAYDAKNDWSKVGLAKASTMKKAQKMMGFIRKTRNWIASYPIEGLYGLLQKGIAEEADKRDSNKCALLLMTLYYEEGNRNQEITALFDGLHRNDADRIISHADDAEQFDKVLKAIHYLQAAKK